MSTTHVRTAAADTTAGTGALAVLLAAIAGIAWAFGLDRAGVLAVVLGVGGVALLIFGTLRRPRRHE